MFSSGSDLVILLCFIQFEQAAAELLEFRITNPGVEEQLEDRNQTVERGNRDCLRFCLGGGESNGCCIS